MVEVRKLTYPRDLCDPKDWLNFVQLDPFPKAWKRLGFDDGALRALEIMIMIDPTGSPVISGTGGLRKLRFGMKEENTGKSGGARVCYIHFAEFGLIGLVTAYGKSRKENLSDQEKKTIKKLIGEIDGYLRGRS